MVRCYILNLGFAHECDAAPARARVGESKLFAIATGCIQQPYIVAFGIDRRMCSVHRWHVARTPESPITHLNHDGLPTVYRFGYRDAHSVHKINTASHEKLSQTPSVAAWIPSEKTAECVPAVSQNTCHTEPIAGYAYGSCFRFFLRTVNTVTGWAGASLPPLEEPCPATAPARGGNGGLRTDTEP